MTPEKLRERAQDIQHGQTDEGVTCEMLEDAADEIERLRGHLADCTRRYTDLLDQLGAGADMVAATQSSDDQR